MMWGTKTNMLTGERAGGRSAKILFLVAVGLLTLSMASALFGCAGKARPATQKSRRQASRRRLEFKSARGSLVIEGAGPRLPAGFPAEMPIYKPSTTRSTVFSRDTSEPPTNMVILRTRASVAEVEAFYQSSLVEKGWTIDSSRTVEPGAVLYAVSSTDAVGSISIGADNETSATIISINASRK